MRKPIAIDDNEIYTLYHDQGLNMKQIAQKLNISTATVSIRLAKIDSAKKKINYKKLIKLYHQNKSIKEIAKIMEVVPRTVLHALEDLVLNNYQYNAAKTQSKE